jgi:endonuclease/exonuclease/phosphatase family metal-dependent hydrolase
MVTVSGVVTQIKARHEGTRFDSDVFLRRRGCELACYCDLTAHALKPWVGDRFIVSGDWNTARLFDEMYPGKWPEAGPDFFAATASWGWSESLRKFHQHEIRTYLDPESAPYELDHLFTDDRLNAALTRCDVIEEPALRELSDHAPLIAEIDLSGMSAR